MKMIKLPTQEPENATHKLKMERKVGSLKEGEIILELGMRIGAVRSRLFLLFSKDSTDMCACIAIYYIRITLIQIANLQYIMIE